MPGPDETLDAPVYEPPRRRRDVLLWLTIATLMLGIFSGVAALIFSRRHKPSETLATRRFLLEVRLACENFRLENGQYPWPKPDGVSATTVIVNKDVYIELRALPGARINTNAKMDFLGGVPSRFLKNGALVDTWGHEIGFRVDPKTGQAVIWSCGENGIDETNDGDSPDPAKFQSYYRFGKGDTGDDIVAR